MCQKPEVNWQRTLNRRSVCKAKILSAKCVAVWLSKLGSQHDISTDVYQKYGIQQIPAAMLDCFGVSFEININEKLSLYQDFNMDVP